MKHRKAAYFFVVDTGDVVGDDDVADGDFVGDVDVAVDIAAYFRTACNVFSY